jgi:hypothetical protein
MGHEDKSNEYGTFHPVEGELIGVNDVSLFVVMAIGESLRIVHMKNDPPSKPLKRCSLSGAVRAALPQSTGAPLDSSNSWDGIRLRSPTRSVIWELEWINHF